MKKYILYFCVLFLLVTQSAWAADHYASPTGSASWANSTNISTPCSLATVWSSATAGSTIYFREGTYEWNTRVTPSGSGSVGNPIVCTRYGTESVIWKANSTDELEAIRLDHPYWTFSYMTWNHARTEDMNSPGDKAFLKLGEESPASHVTVDHITATGCAGGGDNYGIIHAKSSSDYLTVTNCYFSSAYSGVSDNTTCIIIFNFQNFIYMLPEIY